MPKRIADRYRITTNGLRFRIEKPRRFFKGWRSVRLFRGSRPIANSFDSQLEADEILDVIVAEAKAKAHGWEAMQEEGKESCPKD